mmetsp:Transcript_28890/g.46855  ORF Transcript_28890/g.46855 Transcript_28890/m.46855 type:complete len:485 (-) Transcript_28890:68-1522(-)
MMGMLSMLIAVAVFVAAIGASSEAEAAFAAAAEKEDDDGGTSSKSKLFDNLVAWVRHNGGRVDNRLGLTNHKHHGDVDDDDDRLVRGGVALQNIQAGTELLFLPWKIVFGTIANTHIVPENKCDVLQSYAAEVDAGRASFWYEYLALDDSLSSRVPSLWSGLAIAELQGLPPYYNVESTTSGAAGAAGGGGLTDWYLSNCVDNDDESDDEHDGVVAFVNLPSSSRQALLAAITRAAGLRFLPVYDLLNHHNGMVNVQSFADREGDTITTTVDIQKGEEIFISYRGGPENTVDEMFRRYGFVEEWPRYYSWELEEEEEDLRDDDSNESEDADDGNGGTTTRRRHRMKFLVLPQQNVAIYPPTSMLSQIGLKNLNIDDVLAKTAKHNQSLSTQQLIHFRKVGVDFMSTLTTTAEEDMLILEKTNDDLLMMMSPQNLDAPAGEVEQVMDIISAIRYRIKFKQGIQMALDTTNEVLAVRKYANASDEL